MYCAGFMILWCSFLPFALWEICGWATPFVEAAIAFLLLGIENVGAHSVVHHLEAVVPCCAEGRQNMATTCGCAGIQIEEPFHILPMLAYSAGVASNTREQVEQRRGEALPSLCKSVRAASPEGDAWSSRYQQV